MTNIDIIAMAREAGLNDEVLVPWAFEIERFAALVAAAAKAEEREACATVCEQGEFMTFGCVAAAIRERLVNARARAVGDRAYDRYEGETK